MESGQPLMARIKDTSVEAVKAAADFVDVVSARTQLRKAGGRYTGRCPFHEERTPSFSVNAVDKLYYCFGCGAKGDLITFVRETEGLDFAGSIEWLAERFRVELEYEESSPAQDAARKRRERLFALLDSAASFYERTLWETEAGSFVRDYLKGRGLNEEVCREFRLGFALGGDTLARKALAKEFTTDELRAAGLTRQRGGDFFGRRLLFPLTDARGRVLGFQARKLFEDDPLPAKYVNTPESELFHKGSVVYGLDKARAAIAKEDRACVVEGNTDVLALRQAGLQPVVASMGTALTDQQLKELGRLSKRLWLAFDGDAAGETATLRGMALAVQQGFDVKVVPLPPGIDPADDPDGFAARLSAAEPYVLYRTKVEIERAEDRETALRSIKALLDEVPDSPERQDAWRYANDRIGMTVPLRAASLARAAAPTSQRVLDASAKLERNALAGAVAHPTLRPVLAELTAEHFYDPLHRALRDHLVDGAPLDQGGVGLLAELDAYAESEGIGEATGTELLLRLRERELQRELRAAPLDRRSELSEALARLRERAAAISA
ncbi:MAG TPA: DNA primase [Gaiellaceae bacterium]|jgi:DNA primase|nr:DNA primase [Gaiellaceae bacterium]